MLQDDPPDGGQVPRAEPVGRSTALPGPLAVEALAQTSAALLVDLLDDAAGAVGYFAGLQRVRLRDPARPGDTLRLRVELRAFRRGVAWLRGVADVDGRTVATVDFTTVVRARRPEGRP